MGDPKLGLTVTSIRIAPESCKDDSKILTVHAHALGILWSFRNAKPQSVTAMPAASLLTSSFSQLKCLHMSSSNVILLRVSLRLSPAMIRRQGEERLSQVRLHLSESCLWFQKARLFRVVPSNFQHGALASQNVTDRDSHPAGTFWTHYVTMTYSYVGNCEAVASLDSAKVRWQATQRERRLAAVTTPEITVRSLRSSAEAPIGVPIEVALCSHVPSKPYSVHMVSLFIHIAADVNHVERQAEHQGLQESRAKHGHGTSCHVMSCHLLICSNKSEKTRV